MGHSLQNFVAPYDEDPGIIDLALEETSKATVVTTVVDLDEFLERSIRRFTC